MAADDNYQSTYTPSYGAFVSQPQTYDDSQSRYTQMRSTYGDVAANMAMGGHIAASGAYGGMRNMFADIGSMVQPIGYQAPARVSTGFYGQYQQTTGFFRGAAGMVGLEPAPRATTQLEQAYFSAGDFGERVGMGAAGVATTLGGAAVGAALSPLGGIVGSNVGGAVGAALGSLLGPLGAGAGMAAGRMVGGLVGGFGAYALGSMAGGAVNAATGDRRTIENFLESSSFRFVGAGNPMADPRLGTGMNRESRRQTAEMVRSMDIKDTMFNTQDLTQIMQGSAQAGLFNGTQDMADFQKKFKDIVDSVKTVTKVLHTTLDEGLKTIKDLRGIGIDPSQVQSVVQQADALGKTAGRTGAEMIGLGLQGAELFRGTGIQMSIGFESTQMNLSAIRAARDAGRLSQEAISQAGGEEAMAQRATAGGLGFVQSSQGMGFMAAFAGRGGVLNASQFQQTMESGGGSYIGLAQQAANNLGSPAALIAFQANREKIASDAGKLFGGRGLEMMQTGSASAQAGFLSAITGAKKEDAFRYALQQQGMSEPMIEEQLANIKGRKDIAAKEQAGAAATRDKMIVEEASENFIFARLGKKVQNAVTEVVDIAAKPLNSFIDATAQKFQDFKLEQIKGVQSVDVSDVDYKMFRSGGPTASAAKMKVDLDKGGLLAQTSGGALLSALTAGDSQMARDLGITIQESDALGAAPDVTLSRNKLTGTRRGISAKDMDRIARATAVEKMTDEDIKKMQEAGVLKDIKTDFKHKLFEGTLDNVKSAEQLVKQVYGKGVDQISKEQYAALEVEAGKDPKFKQMFVEARDRAMTVEAAKNASQIDMLQSAKKDFSDVKSEFEKKLGHELAPHVLEKILKSDQLRRQGKGKEATSLLEEATADEHALVGGSAKDLGVRLRNLAMEDTVLTQRGVNAAQSIATIQETRGTSALVAAAKLDTAKLSPADRGKAEAILAQVEEGGATALMGLNKEERAILGKAGGAAQQLGQESTVLENFSRSTAKMTGDQLRTKGVAEVDKVAKNLGFDDAHTKQFEEIMKSSGPGEVAKQIFAQTQQNVAGDTGVAAAGASKGIGTEQTSAADQYAKQTEINQSILTAMNAIATRLGVK